MFITKYVFHEFRRNCLFHLHRETAEQARMYVVYSSIRPISYNYYTVSVENCLLYVVKFNIDYTFSCSTHIVVLCVINIFIFKLYIYKCACACVCIIYITKKKLNG